jgi:hypothetical protein
MSLRFAIVIASRIRRVKSGGGLELCGVNQNTSLSTQNVV